MNLRKIIGVTWKENITNTEVGLLARTNLRRLQDIVAEKTRVREIHYPHGARATTLALD